VSKEGAEFVFPPDSNCLEELPGSIGNAAHSGSSSTRNDGQLECSAAGDDNCTVSQQSRADILRLQLNFLEMMMAQMVTLKTKDQGMVPGQVKSKECSQLQSVEQGGGAREASYDGLNQKRHNHTSSILRRSGSKEHLASEEGIQSFIKELIIGIAKSQLKQRDEEATKVKNELEALLKVISSRNQSSSSYCEEIKFTGSLDDDEILVHAFYNAYHSHLSKNNDNHKKKRQCSERWSSNSNG